MTVKPRWLQIEEYKEEKEIVLGISTGNMNGTKMSYTLKTVRAKDMCKKLRDNKACLCHKCCRNCNRKRSHKNKCKTLIEKADKEFMLYNFNMLYLNTFYTENELNITFKEGTIIESSIDTVNTLKNDMEKLNIPENINSLYNKYLRLITCKTCNNKLNKLFVNWLKISFDNLHECMSLTRQKIRNDSLDECLEKCKTQTPLYNLTTVNIKNKHKKLLEKGLNFVPSTTSSEYEFRKELQNHLKNCLLGIYRGVTGEHVKIDDFNTKGDKLSITEVLGLLYLQPSFNTQIEHQVLYSLQKYICTKDKYIEKLKSRSCIAKNSENPIKLNINGGFVSVADKGIAILILPHSWYNMQFSKMLENPNYKLVNLNEVQCVNWLKTEIKKFMNSLTANEKAIFKKHFSWNVKNPRIACIKLLAKLHKLTEKPSTENVLDIPSRVVRGGESCPLNPYSKVLQELLTNLIKDLKNEFKNLTNTELLFPLIDGCEKFEQHVNKINNNPKDFFKTILATSDFSDAFTNLGLEHLLNAIETAATWLNYSESKRTLLIKLAKLIVPYCTFMTPMGIVVSKSGLPIGGHSSAEALNSSLLTDEIDIIMNLSYLADNIKSFCRLVDDCFYALCGDFEDIFTTITMFVRGYPKIDINFQLSPRLATFLDYKIFNLFPNNSKLITTMLRKPLHSYNYVKTDSNVPQQYKGCVIDSTLYRIFRRCNTRKDRINEITYTKKLMQSRGYTTKIFNTKLKNFLTKIQDEKEKHVKDYSKRIRANLKYDGKTNIHNFMTAIVNRARKYFNLQKPCIVPSRKIKDFIKSKRRIISDVAKYNGYENPINKRKKVCPKICTKCSNKNKTKNKNKKL